jgi:hypothetical protein
VNYKKKNYREKLDARIFSHLFKKIAIPLDSKESDIRTRISRFLQNSWALNNSSQKQFSVLKKLFGHRTVRYHTQRVIPLR